LSRPTSPDRPPPSTNGETMRRAKTQEKTSNETAQARQLESERRQSSRPATVKEPARKKMLLIIDNYDSFTYNLVQYFGELSDKHPVCSELRVIRNDEAGLEEVSQINPDCILISPGPGEPSEAGVCTEVIRVLGPTTPILGVCLGHQAIGEVFGGEIVRAKELMHGKTSKVFHDESGVFRGIGSPFTATRYHSLIVREQTLPDCLHANAWLDDGTIMGITHKDHKHIHGVQFHPESILTENGHKMLSNFLDFAAD